MGHQVNGKKIWGLLSYKTNGNPCAQQTVKNHEIHHYNGQLIQTNALMVTTDNAYNVN